MTELELVQKWIERRPNGALRYPLAVRAHLEAILAIAPWALNEKEKERYNKKTIHPNYEN